VSASSCSLLICGNIAAVRQESHLSNCPNFPSQLWAGWFGDDRIEELTADWTTATTDAARTTAADAIQARAFETVPYIHCGQFQIRTAYRKSLTGMIEGGAAFMWNLRRV
jgi:peptide/nickel transport system substrate-binding protein